MDYVARPVYSGAGRTISPHIFGAHFHRYPNSAPTAAGGTTFTFTALPSENWLSCAHSGRANVSAAMASLTTTGALPTPFQVGVDYWVKPVSASAFSLSAVRDGPVIDIVDAGTGTHTVRFKGVQPTADLKLGHVRVWDSTVAWGTVHTADDTYQTDLLDHYITTHWNEGRAIYWNGGRTPTWASSNPGAAGTYANGDAHPPINIASATGPLKEFYTFLINRYNKAAGGVFATDETRIKWVEVWNEAAFSGTGFWKGTATELAQIAKAMKEAIQAVDPAVKIIAPSQGAGSALSNWTLSTSGIKQFLEASDGAAGTGKDHCTGFSWHPYGRHTDQQIIAQDYWARAIGAAYGLTSFHASEWGDVLPPPGATYKNNVYQREYAMQLVRTLAGHAAMGWETTSFYSYDLDYSAGAAGIPPMLVLSNLQQWVGDLFEAIAGRVFTRINLLTSGRWQFVRADGQIFTTP